MRRWPRPFHLLAVLVMGATSLPLAAAPKADLPEGASITVLYDAFGKEHVLDKDWGYAALVEYAGKRILFDTGNDPEVFKRNVAAKKVDLTRLDFVVMSHRHGDHMGGLAHLLAVNPGVRIYAPNVGRHLVCEITTLGL